MPTPREELEQLRALARQEQVVSPRAELEQLRGLQQPEVTPTIQPEIAQPEIERPTAFLPTGEALTQTQRQERGREAVETGIEPILTGGGALLGATVGTLAGPAGTIGGAGLGFATGEKLADILKGEETQPLPQEIKEFGKEMLKGAALEATGIGLGKIAAKGADALSKQLFQSAIKVSRGLSRFERRDVIKAGLDQKIFPTEAGLNRIGSKIKGVNNLIGRGIRKATDRGNVNRDEVAKSFDAVKRLFKNDENASTIVRAIEGRKQRFLTNNPELITPKVAQEMKLGLNREVKNAFQEVKAFKTEGSKALRSGLQKEIERLNPQLRNLNREHRTLKMLETEIDNAVSRIGNRELLSLLATTGAAAGGVGAGRPEEGILAGLAIQLLVSPKTKVGVGVALNRALKASGAVTAARRFAVPAGVSALESE